PATLLPFCLFFFHLSSHPLALHSFPTRRSSDLLVSGTDGRWSERTSLSLRSLENSTRTAPHSRSKSGLGLRAVYRIRIPNGTARDRKSTRLNSSHVSISYAVFCLKKKKKINTKI